MKKYLPITYVDEYGQCWTKKELENKTYKRHEKQTHERKDEFTGYTYVNAIIRISNIRDAPVQGRLF